MIDTTDVVQLFTAKHGTYDRFLQSVRYPQGLRTFFRGSPLFRAGMRILDAGCGTGVVTLALQEALSDRGMRPALVDAFDLTPAMLRRFREKLARRGIDLVRTTQADVLQLGNLPQDWTNYDVIVSASMLEYVPRQQLPEALAALRHRLADGGHLLVFITKRNWLTRPLVGWLWQSNLYQRTELLPAFQEAGFRRVEFRAFPPAARHLAVWGHIVEARNSG